MSKYRPLSDRLSAETADEWRPSFAELEEVLGFPLPKAARSTGGWWEDQEKSHVRAWTEQGWRVGEVDRTLSSVVFQRAGAAVGPPPEPQAPVQTADEVQPPAMKEAAEALSREMHAKRKAGATALIAGGVASLLTVRFVLRRLFGRRR